MDINYKDKNKGKKNMNKERYSLQHRLDGTLKKIYNYREEKRYKKVSILSSKEGSLRGEKTEKYQKIREGFFLAISESTVRLLQ